MRIAGTRSGEEAIGPTQNPVFDIEVVR